MRRFPASEAGSRSGRREIVRAPTDDSGGNQRIDSCRGSGSPVPGRVEILYVFTWHVGVRLLLN